MSYSQQKLILFLLGNWRRKCKQNIVMLEYREHTLGSQITLALK